MSTNYERKSRQVVKPASSNAQKVNKWERQNIPLLKWSQPGIVHACNSSRRAGVLGKPELLSKGKNKIKNNKIKWLIFKHTGGIFIFFFF